MSAAKKLAHHVGKIIARDPKLGIGIALHDPERDTERLVALLNDDDIETWVLRIPKPYTHADAKWFLGFASEQNALLYGGDMSIDEAFKTRKADSIIFKIISEVPVSGKSQSSAIESEEGLLIGGIGIEVLFSNSHNMGHRAGIGYWLGKDYWGKGITTAAVKLLIDFVRKELPSLQRLEASVFINNHASMKVLEKAGFLKECPIVRKAYFKNGKYLDAALFSYIIEREDASTTKTEGNQTTSQIKQS